MSGRFVRLGERDRPVVSLMVDGAPIEALQGDTLMVALLTRKATPHRSQWMRSLSRHPLAAPS